MLIQKIERRFKLVGSKFLLCQGFLNVLKASQLKLRSPKRHRDILFKSNSLPRIRVQQHLISPEGKDCLASALESCVRRHMTTGLKGLCSDSSHRVLLKGIRRCYSKFILWDLLESVFNCFSDILPWCPEKNKDYAIVGLISALPPIAVNPISATSDRTLACLSKSSGGQVSVHKPY